MAGQTEFLQAIQELERLGETNGNQLSMEEINSYFSDMKLEEKQLDFICNYFEDLHDRSVCRCGIINAGGRRTDGKCWLFLYPNIFRLCVFGTAHCGGDRHQCQLYQYRGD